MTREEFEATELTTNRVDMMPQNPNADPACKTCRGFGVCDTGHDTGCILILCPDCWKRVTRGKI